MPVKVKSKKTGKSHYALISTKQLLDYRMDVLGAALRAQRASPAEFDRCRHCPGDYHVTMAAYPPDNLRRDLDNLLKVVMDALVKAHAIADDSRIVRLLATKERVDPAGKGRIVVTITCVNRADLFENVDLPLAQKV